jgi:hypothetical protein
MGGALLAMFDAPIRTGRIAIKLRDPQVRMATTAIQMAKAPRWMREAPVRMPASPMQVCDAAIRFA